MIYLKKIIFLSNLTTVLNKFYFKRNYTIVWKKSLPIVSITIMEVNAKLLFKRIMINKYSKL